MIKQNFKPVSLGVLLLSSLSYSFALSPALEMKGKGPLSKTGSAIARVFRGPSKAVVNAGSQIEVGAVHVGSLVGEKATKGANGVVALYDKAKKKFYVVARGRSQLIVTKALNGAYSRTVKTGTGAGKLALNLREGLESTALVLSGDAVDWAVKTALGIPTDTLQDVPGVGVFMADLSRVTNTLTKHLTSNTKKVVLHVHSNVYSYGKDAVNLVEEVATFQSCPIWAAGNFVWETPKKLLQTVGLVR
jgi:hypothetical protein